MLMQLTEIYLEKLMLILSLLNWDYSRNQLSGSQKFYSLATKTLNCLKGIKMIIKQELVKKIKDYFGLNIYETKVWMALLSKGIASAGEIAEASGVPRSRTYDVLESLEKLGFAIMKLGKPVKYIAVKPNIIIEKLKSMTIRDADERIQNITKLKNTEE